MKAPIPNNALADLDFMFSYSVSQMSISLFLIY